MPMFSRDDREEERFKLEMKKDGIQVSSIRCIAWNVQSTKVLCQNSLHFSARITSPIFTLFL